MTDVVDKAFNAFTNALASQQSGVFDYNSAMGAALATLTPGSTWRTEDGVEVMIVPVEATSVMMGAGYQHRFDGDRSTADIYRAMLSAIRKE